jgi:hypothetical protein
MGELHQHPDGHVFVRTDAGNYADSAGNFATDAGVTLPVLPLRRRTHLFAGQAPRIYGRWQYH